MKQYKIKLFNGDIMTLPIIDNRYCWDSIKFHQELLNQMEVKDVLLLENP